MARRVREAERLWEAIDQMAQFAALDERNLGTLYNAAVGFKIRRSDHLAFAEVSERVATSDLSGLVEAGLLEAVGERRGRYYVAADPPKELRMKTREERTPMPDPFASA